MNNSLLASHHNLTLSSIEDSYKILESGLEGVIFTETEIGPDFFILKNGILGEVFQKLINYRFPIAIVLSADHQFGDRVTELAREHSKHNGIRFCQTIEDAEAWMKFILED